MIAARNIWNVALLGICGLAGLSTVSSAQTPPAPAAQTGAIAGTVIGRESRQGVANAIVTVEGTSVKTNANAGGWFRIENLPPGRVTLVVQAPAYLQLRVENIRIDPGETTAVTVDLPATPNYMERLQVTATKSELSLGDVPGQAEIIDRAEMDRRGVQTLTQAIAHTPGAVVSTELGIFESVMLRGLPRGDPEFTNTLLLVDGVPQTLSNNGARVVTLPVHDAGSIEIVRGPNSALYGRTAIGGAINVRTADPTARNEYGFQITGGEFGTAVGSAHASGPIKSWGGFYASVSGSHDTGYFDNKTTGNYDVGYSSFFGKLTFSPDARGFGSFSVQRVSSNNSTPTDEPIVNGRLLHEIEPDFNRFTNLNIPGPNYEQKETRLTFNYARDLTSNIRLVEVFGYRDVLHDFINDGDFIGEPYDIEANTLAMYPFSQRTQEDIIYQELRVELTPQLGGFRNHVTIGGSYERNNGDLSSDFIFTDPDLFGWLLDYFDPEIPDQEDWQHETSSRTYNLGITGIFAQYMLEPMSRLLVVAGGRYDRLDMENVRDTGVSSDANFDAFSPKLSATVRLLGGASDGELALNAYGAYSQAFLAPRRPHNLLPREAGEPELRPVDIDNWEGGIKGRARDGRLSFGATYFWMKEDGAVLQRRQGAFFFDTNAGERRYKGFETNMHLDVTPRVTVFGNGSFYRNRFGTFVIESEDGDLVLSGNRLPISPDYVVNWGFTFVPYPRFDAIVEVKHVGSTQADDDNTFEIDGYSLVDAALTWRRGAFRITLSARNLLNTEWYGNAGTQTADPGRPRQVLVTAGVDIR